MRLVWNTYDRRVGRAARTAMDEDEKAEARIFISLGGIFLFLSVLCFGCRQLAILEDRIATEARYEILEQELVELTDEGLEEFFYEDNEGSY